MVACMEVFHAERRDRELAHGVYVQKQKDWEDQLASMSQEHERLTGEVLMLKEQLVAIGTTEVYGHAG